MQRPGPNASMQVIIHGFHVSASCAEDGGRSPFEIEAVDAHPGSPTFTYTFGSCASVRIDADQRSNTPAACRHNWRSARHRRSD